MVITIELKWLENISFIKNATSITKLNKGFSFDEKYIIDGNYLIRLFSSEQEQRRRSEFDTINDLSKHSQVVPEAIEFGTVQESNTSYMILSYLPGIDAEIGLSELTAEEQYVAGYDAGQELINLHKLQAPSNYPSWYSVKKKKSDRYISQLQMLNVDSKLKELLVFYIKENERLMEGRPNTFQHDDYHPANLLIHNRKFSGIIDFQRMDWGDPVHDLHKLGFFSKNVSIDFTIGIIDGYHGNKVNHSFWQLYALYSAMHVVSSLVWGHKMGKTTFDKFLQYSYDVIADHESFKKIIPSWYR